VVVLYEYVADALGCQGALVVGLEEKAAFIGKHPGLDDLDFWQPSRYNAHTGTSLLSIAPPS